MLPPQPLWGGAAIKCGFGGCHPDTVVIGASKRRLPAGSSAGALQRYCFGNTNSMATYRVQQSCPQSLGLEKERRL